MNPHYDKEEELRRREQELRQRELALRLQELEAEIQPPVVPTVKHQPPEGKMQRWSRRIVKVAKFLGMVVIGLVVIRIATWLSAIVFGAALLWLVYKIFFEEDQTQP